MGNIHSLLDLKKDDDVKQLIKLCRQNNRKAQKMLFDIHHERAYNMCRKFGKCQDDVEELTHTGMIKVYTNLHKYNYKGSFEGWVFRVIYNNAVSYTRDKYNKNVNLVSHTLGMYHENEHSEEYVYHRERQLEEYNHEYHTDVKTKAERIKGLTQYLSPAYKRVFELVYYEGVKYSELIIILGITIGTAKSNLAKARANIKKLYIERYGEY